MKRALLGFLLLLGSVIAAFAQDAIVISGLWNMTIETSQGATPVSLTFTKVEGEDIVGTLSSPQGDLNISGKLRGAEINFSGTFETNGNSLTLSFVGKIEKEIMSGTVDFGGMGTSVWSAKRPG